MLEDIRCESENEAASLRVKVAELEKEILRLRRAEPPSGNGTAAVLTREAEWDRAQLLHAAVESALDCIFVKDTSLRYIQANRAMAALFGMAREEIIGKSDTDLFGAEAATHIEEVDRTVLGGCTVEEFPSRPVNGVMKHFHTVKAPLYDVTGKIGGLCGIARDISEFKMSEDALRESEALLKSIFSVAPVGIGLTQDRALLKVNDMLCHMTGYEREEMIGRSARMLYASQEDFDYVGRENYRQIEARGIGSVETRWRRKDGAIIDVILSSAPLHTEDSSKGFTFTALDITQRKLTEEAARQSETMYRDYVRNAPNGVFIVDGDGAYLEVNPAACAMTGYSENELLRMKVPNILAPESFEWARDHFNRALVHGASSGEGWYMRKDGERRYWRVDGVRLFENRLMGFAVDVTERKLAEEALRMSETEKHAILNAIQELVTLQKLDRTIVYANRAAAESVGASSPQELVGKKCFEMWRSLSDRCADCPISEVLKDRAPHYGEARTPDGRYWALTGYPINSASGEIIALVEVAADITDRKKAEEMFLQSERHKAVADLASGVAHNFNNLLQIVMGNAFLSLSNLQSGDLRDMKKCLNEILDIGEFGAETVRRLNAFARPFKPREKTEQDTFDLSEVAAAAVEMSKPWWKALPEKLGLRIVVTLDLKKGCMVTGRKNEIFDVVINLVKNASEALTKGGEIHVRTYMDGEWAVLQVHDTGIGISGSDLGRLFTPFYTTKAEMGTGLGLAVSRTIVDAHGGGIEVVSREGEGAVFTVRLPLVRHASKPIDAQPVRTAHGSCSVLVVDDMPQTVHMLARGLVKLGHEVLQALDGEQALALFERHTVDAVVCDLAMPGMNGRDVGKAIMDASKRKGLRKPPFVLLTGWGGQDDDEAVNRVSGIDAVAYKPIDLNSLNMLISQLLQDAAPRG